MWFNCAVFFLAAPYSWTEDRIYLWLLRICDKYHKISPTLVTRLTPFINNFHSGDFGDLDEELRDIIAIEHRRLFDNCLSPVSSPSVYDSEDGLDSELIYAHLIQYIPVLNVLISRCHNGLSLIVTCKIPPGAMPVCT